MPEISAGLQKAVRRGSMNLGGTGHAMSKEMQLLTAAGPDHIGFVGRADEWTRGSVGQPVSRALFAYSSIARRFAGGVSRGTSHPAVRMKRSPVSLWHCSTA